MQLETARLIVRTPIPEDTEAYVRIHNSEFVLRYNAMTPKNAAEIRKQFSNIDTSDLLVIQHKETGEILGSISVEEDSIRWGIDSKEVSYFLDEEYSRQGYMKEALGVVVDYLFEAKKLQCISARSFAPNVASRKLLESLGFQQNGYIPACVKGYGDIIFDDTLYSLFRK